MGMTLALAAALSVAPGQADALTLTDVRTTYGILGAARPGDKFLPGDAITLSFTADGVKPDAAGKVRYSIGMVITDAEGEVRFKQSPREMEANNSLGGSSLPVAANLQVGLDQPPGTYKVKVTIKDLGTGAAGTLTRSYEILPKGFGLVRPALTSDAEGKVQATFPAEGQTLWVHFGAVGFERDDGGQPNLRVVLRVLDEEGKPTLEKPFVGEVSKGVPKNAAAVPMQFILQLNRAGKFTAEVAALDKVSGKKASLTIPLTVLKEKSGS